LKDHVDAGLARSARTPESINVPPQPFIRSVYDQLVADTLTALGKAEFNAAWSKGGAMTLDQSIEFGLL
jgi:hypothetical protein